MGITIECNWPLDMRSGREIVVGTFVDLLMTPGEIHALVREWVVPGRNLDTLHNEALRFCTPTWYPLKICVEWAPWRAGTLTRHS